MSQQPNFQKKRLKANVLGVNVVLPRGMPTLQQRPWPSPPLLLHQLVGLQPEKGGSNKE